MALKTQGLVREPGLIPGFNEDEELLSQREL